MSRRPYCPTNHEWRAFESKPNTFYCLNCPIKMPCATGCPHVDCEQARGSAPVCHLCDKPVTLEDSFWLYKGEKDVRVHITCRKGESHAVTESTANPGT